VTSPPHEGRHEGELRWRLRLAACSLALVALAIVQKPGFLVADTKLDLAVDPGAFLARALHLWDPQGAFGQVQNQAYGYLFPMGPWFLAGSALDIPGWLVQRSWVALVMVVAFLGVVRLAGAMGIGGPLSRIVAGFAYALSPRMITTLGPISVEAWPSAMVPWVLLPLVLATTGRLAPRRAAALSALAVALTGGVNAAASAAVLPLGIVWLLSRSTGQQRRSLLLWWPLLTLLGTLWWLVPLFLLGRYSPPFLDFIENATVTTVPTTLFDTLRGTSAWVPYIEPGWTAGNDLLTTGFLILNSGVVMVVGLVGLARPDLPHRRFLVLALLVGMLMVTAGHLGVVHGWFAAPVQQLLDGPLSPLRNVHKFDPVLRLAMVMGVAHALEQLRRRAVEVAAVIEVRDRQPAVVYAGVLSLTVVAVLGAASPAWSGRLAPAGEFAGIPGYWEDAADWLTEQPQPTRALLLPGSSFGTYVWGTPRDEPFQVLARSPWAVRDAVPLTPPGTIRMLDAVEARLADGRGSPGLARYLRRAGVSHLVVRNDLARRADLPDPVLVHQTLDGSPGIWRVATFGPPVGGESRLDDGEGPPVVVSHGWQTRYPAVEIYAVGSARPAVESRRPVLVAGGPESLLDLADHDVVSSTPTVLAVDATRRPDGLPSVLTDGLRRQETTFGRLHDARSSTLVPGEERRPDAPAREYALTTSPRWETRAELLGARRLTASSSMADATASGRIRPEWQPWSAFDGDSRTQWVSSPSSQRAWIDLELSRPRTLPLVRVTAGDALGDRAQLVRAVTDGGRGDVVEVSAGQTVTIRLPEGETSRLRIEEGSPTGGRRLALAEVDTPGIHLARPLRMPRLREGWRTPAAIVMSTGDGTRSGCVTVDGDTRCDSAREQRSEEPFGLDRLVSMNDAETYEAEVAAEPVGGTALEALLQQDKVVQVSASSAVVDATVSSALAAVDGDLGTTWVADPTDVQPVLDVNWLGATEISGISLIVDVGAAANPPTTVTVAYDGEEQTVELDDEGFAELEPVRTDGVELTLEAEERGSSIGFDNAVTPLGIGVSELRIDGLDVLPSPPASDVRSYGCGSGPSLVVNGAAEETRLVASPRDVFLGREVAAEVCGSAEVALRAGENRVRLLGSDVAAGRALVLRSDAAAEFAPALEVGLESETPTRRTIVRPGAGVGSTVAVRENVNPGWEAADAGASPLVVDGWQQGWSLSADQGRRLTAEFSPDGAYRAALLVGAFTLLLLGLICLRRPRLRLAGNPTEVGDGPVRLAVAAPMALLAAGLLAGWAGVAVAVLSVALALLGSPRFGEEVWPWAAASPVAVATTVYWWRPLGSEGGWAGALALPQYLVLVSLVLVVIAASQRGGPTDRSPMKGRSTSR
jgi:arabinofuranan 3-O-arabinosyltransferase